MLRSRGYLPVKPNATFSQQLTHQRIEAQFFLIDLNELSEIPATFSFRTKRELDKLAFPKMLRQYLNTTAPFG